MGTSKIIAFAATSPRVLVRVASRAEHRRLASELEGHARDLFREIELATDGKRALGMLAEYRHKSQAAAEHMRRAIEIEQAEDARFHKTLSREGNPNGRL